MEVSYSVFSTCFAWAMLNTQNTCLKSQLLHSLAQQCSRSYWDEMRQGMLTLLLLLSTSKKQRSKEQHTTWLQQATRAGYKGHEAGRRDTQRCLGTSRNPSHPSTHLTGERSPKAGCSGLWAVLSYSWNKNAGSGVSKECELPFLPFSLPWGKLAN